VSVRTAASIQRGSPNYTYDF